MFANNTIGFYIIPVIMAVCYVYKHVFNRCIILWPAELFAPSVEIYTNYHIFSSRIR